MEGSAGVTISGSVATTGCSPVYTTSPGFRISQDMLGKNIVRVQEQREPLYCTSGTHGTFLHTESFNSHSNCQLSCHQHSVINEEAEALLNSCQHPTARKRQSQASSRLTLKPAASECRRVTLQWGTEYHAANDEKETHTETVKSV